MDLCTNLIENNDIEKSFSKAISTMINLDSFSIEQNLKDVYEDEKSIGSSLYSITSMQNRYSEDDYFDYKIPEKIVVQR